MSLIRLRSLCSLLPCMSFTGFKSSLAHCSLQPGDKSPNSILNPCSSSPILYCSNNTSRSVPAPLTLVQKDFKFGLATTWTSCGCDSQTRENANFVVSMVLFNGEHSIRCTNSGRVIDSEKRRHSSRPVAVSPGSAIDLSSGAYLFHISKRILDNIRPWDIVNLKYEGVLTCACRIKWTITGPADIGSAVNSRGKIMKGWFSQ